MYLDVNCGVQQQLDAFLDHHCTPIRLHVGSKASLDKVYAIYEAVTAKCYRRSAVSAETIADIKHKINLAVKFDEPILFSIPFGGYKGWQQPFAPGVNWAEVYWLRYLSAYAAAIAAVHPAGVRFSLSYFSGVLEWVNGLPLAAQEKYISELERLLLHFSVPGITFELVDLTNYVGGVMPLMQLLQERYFNYRKHWPLAESSRLEKIASAKRNIYLGNAILSETEKINLAKDAALRCDAMESLEMRRQFNKYGKHIQLTHIRGASLALHLGSCATSIAQPWVSSGIAEIASGFLRPRIISLATTLADLEWLPCTAHKLSSFNGLQQIAIRNS